MDITPHVNLLRSLRGQRIDYVLFVGEAVDNAFDAGAKRIDIIINESKVSFQDDGVGITRDRIASLLSLGSHGQMSTTELGRFGVGIKHQVVSAGNIFEIASTSTDGRVGLVVDWRTVLNSGQWKTDDPRWKPVAVGSPTGTTITVSDLRKPPSRSVDKIAHDIALRFHPAIADGRQISLNGDRVALLSEPPMSDLIEKQISLTGGRSAHLRAGILIHPSKLNKVHVSYKHRVIMPASSVGCAEYGGLTKMFARLQISGPWHLSTFKSDLPDEEEREELESEVCEALRPILEKCNSAALSARVNEIAHLVNDLIPPSLSGAKPNREKQESSPSSKERKSRQGSVAPEKSEPSGPAKSKRPPQDRLLITFDGVDEEDGIGGFQPGRPNRVNLSKDNLLIARLLEHRDQDIAVHSLFGLAISLYEQGRQARDPQLELDGTFGQRVARLLSIQQFGASAGQVA